MPRLLDGPDGLREILDALDAKLSALQEENLRLQAERDEARRQLSETIAVLAGRSTAPARHFVSAQQALDTLGLSNRAAALPIVSTPSFAVLLPMDPP